MAELLREEREHLVATRMPRIPREKCQRLECLLLLPCVEFLRDPAKLPQDHRHGAAVVLRPKRGDGGGGDFIVIARRREKFAERPGHLLVPHPRAPRADDRRKHAGILFPRRLLPERLPRLGIRKCGERLDDFAPHARVRLNEALHQCRARIVRVHLLERLRSLAAHAVESIGIQHPLELLRARCVLLVAERLHDKHATDDVARELTLEHLRRRLEFDLREERVVRIHAHQLRRAGQREKEIFLGLARAHFEIKRLVLPFHKKPHRKIAPKQRHLGAQLLHLLHVQPRLLRRRVPRIVHLQLRHSAVVQPLVEKLIERKPRLLLQHRLQIIRRHNPVPVPLHIRMDALAVQLRPEPAADHVQHPRALRIHAVAELLHRVAVVAPHDRLCVRRREDALRLFPHLEQHRIAPVALLLVERGVVRRKAFVQPQVRPVAARHQIAEPLVRRLVRVEPVQRAELLGVILKKQARRLKRAARVLHSARGEIEAIHLVVFVPCKGHADLALEKPDDLRGVAKRIFRLLLFRRRHEHRERQRAGLALDLVKKSRGHRHEVIHMRLVLLPVPRIQPVHVLLPADERAVRHHLHPIRHMADHLAREALIWIIVTRKPEAMLLRLALTPHLRVARLAARLRRAEMQADLRLRMVRDAHARLGIRRDRLLENEDQLFIRQLVLRDGRPLRRDRVNRQPDRIEFESREWFCDRLEAQRRRAAHRALRKIGRHIELQVQDVHEAIARVFPPRLVGQRRRHEVPVVAADRVGLRCEAGSLHAAGDCDDTGEKFSDAHPACSCGPMPVSTASFKDVRRDCFRLSMSPLRRRGAHARHVARDLCAQCVEVREFLLGTDKPPEEHLDVAVVKVAAEIEQMHLDQTLHAFV